MKINYKSTTFFLFHRNFFYIFAAETTSIVMQCKSKLCKQKIGCLKSFQQPAAQFINTEFAELK